MTRNEKGMIGWFSISIIITLICSFIFGNVCAAIIPLFVGLLAVSGRELYQYKKYNLTAFEWEDVWTYSATVLLGVTTVIFAMIAIGIVE